MRRSSGLCLCLVLAAGCGRSGRGDPSAPTPTPQPTPSCQPEAGGPHWLQEGETLAVTVRCATGMDPTGAQLSLAALPEGASWDPAAAMLRWTPALDQAAVYEIAVTAGGTGETAILEIGVADAWEDPANVPVVDPVRYPREYGLPVFFLSHAPAEKRYEPATIVHGGHVYTAEAKLRGASSIDYPKNNFTLKFAKSDRFREPSQGFHGVRKLVLYGNFDDNSHIRTRLAFDLWNCMDPEHIQVRTYSAVLYLGGEYWGQYTVTEHIDDDLMEAHGHDEKGDLFKAVDYPADFTLAGKSTPHEGYEKKEGVPEEEDMPGAWTDLDALVRFVAGSDPATFRARVRDELDLRDYQDWWILVMAIYGNDNLNKNSYHFHDTGPFRLVPWDFTASFGQNWRTVRRKPHEETEFPDGNLLFERFLGDPELREPMVRRYAGILAERCTAADLLGWIDGYTGEFEASARRDERKWGHAYRSFPRWAHRTDINTWEEEVQYVRDWVKARWEHQRAKYGG